jgi:cardiolipin synthase
VGLANWLTMLRILLIPVFVTLLVYRRPGLALLVFCLASLTDLLDGYIARARGRQTRLGAFLDPVADKLLLTSAFVTLTYLKVIPFWITAVVVSRDLVTRASSRAGCSASSSGRRPPSRWPRGSST